MLIASSARSFARATTSPPLQVSSPITTSHRSAPIHLLVIPERHVGSLHDISEFPADEAKRMLDFVAETAAAAGLDDYRVVVNVGAEAGQTVFHLHWHVLGGRSLGGMG